MLSASAWPDWLLAQAAQTSNATLDKAQILNFSPAGSAPAMLAAGGQGTIANNAGAGEVDWFSFTLNQASNVHLAAFDGLDGQHLESVLSLYNTEASDPFYSLSYTAPPFNPQQHRLLTQIDTGADGTPEHLDRQLASGTYFVAVSGHGNSFFNPFLAGSGYAGSTGDYRLLVTATSLPSGPADGPTVLNVDPGLLQGSTSIPFRNSSPLAIHVGLSSPIDPSTVSLLQPWSLPGDPPPTVQLTYNLTGKAGNDQPVMLAGFHYAPDAQELQLQVATPLLPGFYRLTLAGNAGSTFRPVLMDATDTVNLGQNSAHPTGQDFTTTFQINGSEGTPGATTAGNDTASTASALGDLTQGQLGQAVGAIGDDPAYDPSLPFSDSISSTAPFLTNPASDVDLYHFHVNGTGPFDFAAEIFAGRIGSTLDAAISLFRLDASNSSSSLQFVASNDNSSNPALSSDGQARPLVTDPVLDVGLTGGDYYLAVSSSGNMPGLNGNRPGTNGIFDPNVSHSGANGISTGNYVLNLLLQPAAPAPHVVATSPSDGETLTAPPRQLTVTFDSSVNVSALANQAFDATSESTVAGVFFVQPNGQRISPRLQSYDAATNQATFLMLDRLPNGVNELHLSGAKGLTGVGGVPLVGNDPSGDHVVSYTVHDPASPPDPLRRKEQAPNKASNGDQDLGTLFPHEVQDGVTVAGKLASSRPGKTADSDAYTIELLEPQEYHFTLAGPAHSPGGDPTTLPSDVELTITDAKGVAVVAQPEGDPNTLFANLAAGNYTITISRSSKEPSASVPYELRITLLSAPENPPPLSIEVTPVLQIRPASDPATPDSGPVTTPVATIPTPKPPPQSVPPANPGTTNVPPTSPESVPVASPVVTTTPPPSTESSSAANPVANKLSTSPAGSGTANLATNPPSTSAFVSATAVNPVAAETSPPLSTESKLGANSVATNTLPQSVAVSVPAATSVAVNSPTPAAAVSGPAATSVAINLSRPAVGPTEGPATVVPVSALSDRPVGREAAATGNTSSTQPSLSTLALTLRADPVGGVTGGNSNALASVSGPLQIQGLSNTPAFALGNLQPSSTAVLNANLIAPSGSSNDLVQGNAPPLLDSTLLRSASPALSVAQPSAEQLSRSHSEGSPEQPLFKESIESFSNSSVQPAFATLSQEEVGVVSNLTLQSEGTRAETGETARKTSLFKSAPTTTTLTSVIFGMCGAVFLLLGKAHHAPESEGSPRQRKIQLHDRASERS